MRFFVYQMTKLFDKGKLKEANELQAYIVEIINILASSGNYFSSPKYLMRKLGVDCGGVRSPFHKLDLESLVRVISTLEEASFFTKLAEAQAELS